MSTAEDIVVSFIVYGGLILAAICIWDLWRHPPPHDSRQAEIDIAALTLLSLLDRHDN